MLFVFLVGKSDFATLGVTGDFACTIGGGVVSRKRSAADREESPTVLDEMTSRLVEDDERADTGGVCSWRLRLLSRLRPAVEGEIGPDGVLNCASDGCSNEDVCTRHSPLSSAFIDFFQIGRAHV